MYATQLDRPGVGYLHEELSANHGEIWKEDRVAVLPIGLDLRTAVELYGSTYCRGITCYTPAWI